MSNWTTPEFTELRMDAEIGSYQDDSEREAPPFARVARDASEEATTSEG